MDRHRPARHREQPGRHREQPRRHRCSTGAHTDPGSATATPRLSQVVPRWSPGECLQSPGIARFIGKLALCQDATGIHRGSAWSLPATTAIKPGRCRSSAGVCCQDSPGESRRSYGRPGFARTLPAFTGAPPGHYRRQPGLCRGFTGINRSLFGFDRDSATFMFNNIEYLFIFTQLTFTCAYIRSYLHYRAKGTLSMCIKSIY